MSIAHIAPFVEKLRFLLLNEPLEKLAAIKPVEKAGTGRPTEFERLIPQRRW